MPGRKTPLAVAQTGTRIRAVFAGETIADSRQALLLRETPVKMHYAFPEQDVRAELLEQSEKMSESERRGRVRYWHIRVGERTASDGAFAFDSVVEDRPDMRGYVLFQWGAMDRWFEESEELIGHPRDPFTRIDVRRSDRHVRVEAGGVTVAESRRPLLLMETGLPVRYYIPNEDVAWDYFEASETETICPYKGRARYWSIVVNGNRHDDMAWAYRDPLQDAMRVQDAVCFYQEKLTVFVDGVEEKRPPRYFTK